MGSGKDLSSFNTQWNLEHFQLLLYYLLIFLESIYLGDDTNKYLISLFKLIKKEKTVIQFKIMVSKIVVLELYVGF